MQSEAASKQPPLDIRTRNPYALAALWTIGATWLAGVVVAFYAGLFDGNVSENVGWVLLAVGAVGFLLTLVALTTARSRAELTLALAALALVIASVLVAGSPLLYYGFGSGE